MSELIKYNEKRNENINILKTQYNALLDEYIEKKEQYLKLRSNCVIDTFFK